VSESVLAMLILVFVIWPTQIFSATVSKWIVIIAAVLLILHLFCPCRKSCEVASVNVKKPKKKFARKKKR